MSAAKRLGIASLALLLLVPSGLAGSTDAIGACRISVQDPPGDVDVWPTTQPYSAPAADFLAITFSLTDDELVYQVSLAGDPRDSSNRYYRYWLGFEVKTSAGGPFYVDFRVHSTATYDLASFVGPNEMGNPLWGEFPVTWDSNATMEIRIPVETIRDSFGQEVLIGAPRAGSDGEHFTDGAQGVGLGAPYVMDRAGPPEFRPLTPCMVETLEAEPRETPIAFGLALLAISLAALGSRRLA